MNLSPEQLATLKAAIIADPTAGPIRLAGDTASLNEWLNGASSAIVWRLFTSGDLLRTTIVWANMTPADSPDGTATYTNRALYCQAKQISLQTLVQNVQQVATGVQGIRSGLQDCLTQLPSGVGGAIVAAGWTAVRTAMQRTATRCEQIVGALNGTPATPSDIVWEGPVSSAQIAQLAV